MCFSIAVDKNISKLSNYFGAQISAENSRSIQKLFTALKQNINEVLEMLTHKEAVKYKYEWAM